MNVSDVVDLVRLPAVASAPGDPLVGALSSGGLVGPKTAGAAASSCLMYLAGMALNDYADRKIDAEERPQRPVPSGRVPARAALAIGLGLMGAGIALSAGVNGRRGLTSAGALSTSIVAYDFVTKNTVAGPFTMAVCRGLNVLHGASSLRAAAVPSAVMAAHTLAVTGVSASEVEGGDVRAANMACASSALSIALVIAWVRNSSPAAQAARAIALTGFAGTFGRAAWQARAAPTPQRLQAAVGAGVMGMMPLQASLMAARNKTSMSAALSSLWLGMRVMAKRRTIT